MRYSCFNEDGSSSSVSYFSVVPVHQVVPETHLDRWFEVGLRDARYVYVFVL